jgi:hypothetical protein
LASKVRKPVPLFHDWLFRIPEGKRSLIGIILWWEVRRIPVNFVVGSIGFISLILFYLAISSSGHLEPGEDAVEPIALFAAPILFNIAYTGGWLAEIALRILWRDSQPSTGPILLKVGIAFSIFVVLLPSVFWGCYWLLNAIGIL